MRFSTVLLSVALLVALTFAEPTGTSKDNKTKKVVPEKKTAKAKENPWKSPNAASKKLFTENKKLIQKKLIERRFNVTEKSPLEPVKHGLQTIEKTSLHHYLIKLPDGKYAHAIIALNKDPKSRTPVNENQVSVRRTIFDNLAAAENQ